MRTAGLENECVTGTDFDDLSSLGLASLYRELSYNAPGLAAQLTYGADGVKEASAGTRGDRNTELLLRRA